MRALTISAHGGLEQLEVRSDLPVPELACATDVRLRVTAAALNHLDLFVVAGLPGVTIVPPWVVASDVTGVVDAIGSDVDHVRVGDHVVVNPGSSDGTCDYCRRGDDPLCLHYQILGEHRPGGAAEYVVVPGRSVRAIPSTIAPEVAAAFPLVTLTAWRMVVTRAAVQAGENVLIHGIGGGAAQAALQICKLLGARVWVTSRSEEKLARARALGADETLDSRSPDVGKIVRDRTGKRGVEVVIDNVGRATWAQSLMALGRGGRLVTCGATTGPMVETDLRRMFWSQWNLMGSTMGSTAEFEAIVEHLKAGRLIPTVDSVWPLDQGRKAYERLASGQQFGKVVIRVGS